MSKFALEVHMSLLVSLSLTNLLIYD